VKRSAIVDGKGYPLGVVVAGANVHDCKLLEPTIDAMVVGRPEPGDQKYVDQHLCLDKGYDNPTGESAALDAGYIPHIRRIGEEKLDETKRKTQTARRWVVERFGRWLTGCRAILVRYAKKSTVYQGLIHLQCALLWYRRIRHAGEMQI
jgi:putative transposase